MNVKNKNIDMKNITKRIKNGNDVYVVQVRKIGNRHPSKTFNSLKEAQAYRSKCDYESYNAVNPVAKPVTTERFRDTIKYYIDNINKFRRKQTSRDSEIYRLNRFLRDEKGFCKLFTATITDNDINAFINKRLKNVSSDTVIRELTQLRSVYRQSMRRLRIEKSPFDSHYIDRPIASEPRDRILSADERVRLAEACKNSKSPWLVLAVNFLLETGFRRGELVSIRYSDVEYFDDGCGAVFIRDVKNSRQPNKIINKKLPLSRKAIQIIKIIRDSALVNGDRIFPLRADSVSQMFERVVKKAGIIDYRLHDLRHERVTSLANSGTPVAVIMKVTGHYDERSVKRYNNPDHHIALEYLKKAEERSFFID
ncbi:Site-specific recombinase XerD [Bartonella apihabitans]|uniref:tyrosine-type recombinase/integrase n=1 Tax=Bartonella apihabitans TaxID=2750929 RepID=UPI00098FBCB7|nr:site-specific integrase [Bartonella apihabitans]AQT44835.1 Site-specific recombinase XerD [Bartonella apihabitans]